MTCKKSQQQLLRAHLASALRAAYHGGIRQYNNRKTQPIPLPRGNALNGTWYVMKMASDK
jgi:hypothetical protein